MAGHLRRRGGVYWFRRRVPDALVERLGSREVQRSLRTSNSRTAARRAKQAWLVTKTAFREMTADPSLAAAQAKLLIDQLLKEAVLNSTPADYLVEAWSRGQHALTKQLFHSTAIDVIMALPEDDRFRVGMHMDRMAGRIEADFLRRKLDWEDTKAQAALMQAADATARAEDAERKVAEAEIGHRVAERLKELSAAAAPAAEPDAAVPTPLVAKRKSRRGAPTAAPDRRSSRSRPPSAFG